MPTLQDIANIVGVSSATVSLALSNNPRISDEMKAKVRKTAIEIGYKKVPKWGDDVLSNPNTRSRSIGVLYLGSNPQNMNQGFFKDGLMGVCQEAARIDRTVVMLGIQATEQIVDPDELFDQVTRSGAEGIIVVSTAQNLYGLDKLLGHGFPMVFIGNRTLADRKERLHTVATDLQDAKRTGLDYLIELGHKRIAVLMAESNLSQWSREWPQYEGAEITTFIVSAPFDPTGEDWNELKNYGATAIFAANVPLGHAAMNFLRAIGKSVPEQVSLISYDDAPSYPYENPPITAVKQNMESIGRQSTKMLCELLETPGQSPTQVMLPTQLVVRKSCAPPTSI
ncbi:MAG: transcriptional regulator, LacI family [Paenibacillus sp.]|nr:transcriptional regulator, LacI family [Paenibacillus sp.]